MLLTRLKKLKEASVPSRSEGSCWFGPDLATGSDGGRPIGRGGGHCGQGRGGTASKDRGRAPAMGQAIQRDQQRRDHPACGAEPAVFAQMAWTTTCTQSIQGDDRAHIQCQGNRLNASGIPVRPEVQFMGDFSLRRSPNVRFIADRALRSAAGPAPVLEGTVSLAGSSAAGAVRHARRCRGLRRDQALGAHAPGVPPPFAAV